jgi:hypothetical protein
LQVALLGNTPADDLKVAAFELWYPGHAERNADYFCLPGDMPLAAHRNILSEFEKGKVDLRGNPDAPQIYAAFVAKCEAELVAARLLKGRAAIKNKKAVVAQRQAVIDRNYSSHWVAREYQMGEQVYIHIPYAKRKASKNPKPEGRLIAWGTEAVVLERGPASAPSFRVLFLNHGPSNELPSSISKVLYKWNDLMPVDGMGKVTLNPKALRFGQNILERVREMKQSKKAGKKAGKKADKVDDEVQEAEVEEDAEEQAVPCPGADNTYWDVEHVIGQRWKGGTLEFKIRWKGYSKQHDSWEPARNVKEEFLQDLEIVASKENPSPGATPRKAAPAPASRPSPNPKLPATKPATKFGLAAAKARTAATKPVSKAAGLPEVTPALRRSGTKASSPGHGRPNYAEVRTSDDSSEVSEGSGGGGSSSNEASSDSDDEPVGNRRQPAARRPLSALLPLSGKQKQPVPEVLPKTQRKARRKSTRELQQRVERESEKEAKKRKPRLRWDASLDDRQKKILRKCCDIDDELSEVDTSDSDTYEAMDLDTVPFTGRTLRGVLGRRGLNTDGMPHEQRARLGRVQGLHRSRPSIACLRLKVSKGPRKVLTQLLDDHNLQSLGHGEANRMQDVNRLVSRLIQVAQGRSSLKDAWLAEQVAACLRRRSSSACAASSTQPTTAAGIAWAAAAMLSMWL